MKEILISSPEVAVVFAKQLAMIRVISMSVAFLFWCFISLLMLVLYLHNIISIPALSQSLQVGSLLGLTPIVLAVVVWRVVEKAFCIYILAYARKHIAQ